MQVNQDTRLSNWKEVAAPMQSTGVSSKVSWDYITLQTILPQTSEKSPLSSTVQAAESLEETA